MIAFARNAERKNRSRTHALAISAKPASAMISSVPKLYALLPAIRSATSLISHEITSAARASRTAAITVMARLSLLSRNSSRRNGRRSERFASFALFAFMTGVLPQNRLFAVDPVAEVRILPVAQPAREQHKRDKGILLIQHVDFHRLVLQLDLGFL